MNSNKLQEKEAQLRENLRHLGSLAVAFSGGVDSTFLLKVAHEELGDRLLAVTARGSVFSGRDLSQGMEFCRQEGIRQEIVEMNELEIPGFSDNPPDRCYICKKTIFQSLLDTAASHGIAHVAEGSNMDDLGDYRPGLRALRELQVLSPLKEAGLYKEEIRQLSRELHLPTWDKPSAACLASRFAYGERITREKLRMVEQAEDFLADQGFRQVRVRIHGADLARLEVAPEQREKLLSLGDSVTEALRQIGFTYVTMDLKGYRTGSMNEILKDEEKKGVVNG